MAVCDSHLHVGYCGLTDSGRSDCSKGSKGSWEKSWPTRASGAIALPNELMRGEGCIQRCLACQRCRYVSFSLAARDCSWFHSCTPHQLESHYYGELWRTVHVRRADGSLVRLNGSTTSGGARAAGAPCVTPHDDDEEGTPCLLYTSPSPRDS